MDALERGMHYLSIKMRTEQEVREHLREKGYGQGEIREAIQSLKDYHYLDDAQFVRYYVKYGFEKGRGLERIQRELRAKGIELYTIEDVVYEMERDRELPDQRAMAEAMAEAIVLDFHGDAGDYKELQKLKGRVARRLQSRGFSSDIVYSVINNLNV